ncbi:TPA: hypothetical protein DEO28_03380 [Candidatus Dependentiae bacterium]|nr:MAG: hypothetical protein UR43_C0004G0203 [candidate division TM6 bacterium GW2011_GWF2_33_332]HBS48099.1 hypothetical protein [Candidatus Dependentiae bacterium]HBZ73523.1 hypothetical protein [Candidatus Dependentiae bacterium]
MFNLKKTILAVTFAGVIFIGSIQAVPQGVAELAQQLAANHCFQTCADDLSVLNSPNAALCENLKRAILYAFNSSKQSVLQSFRTDPVWSEVVASLLMSLLIDLPFLSDPDIIPYPAD